MKRAFYFDPHASGIEVFLGPTEAKLMELAWRKKRLTVKSALYHLDSPKELAYTTVMTVLSRLADKGLLHKHKEGRGFVYSPVMDRAAFIRQRVRTVRGCIKRHFKESR